MTDMAGTYRKKPVEVHAIRYHGTNAGQVIEFMGGAKQAKAEERMLPEPGQGIIIHTLEGDIRASVGDWIICGAQGEFYPCKPDIFELTYEPAGDARPYGRHPEPDSVPGWGKAAVQDLIRRVRAAEPGDGWYESKDGDGDLLDALLYDAKSYQRAAARHQRALEERDAARAERDDLRHQAASFEAMLATAREEVDQTRLQAAEARTLADSYAEQMATARREIDDYVDWSNSLTDHIPDDYDGDYAQEEIISRWVADIVAERERLIAELATARRDAAADALEEAAERGAGLLTSPYYETAAANLRRWAAEVRSGVRTIPVSEPAEEGGAGDGE